MTTPPPPSRMESPRLSTATLLLIALNVAVWLLQAAGGVPLLHPPSSALIAWGGNLPLLSLTGDSWRLLTAMFLHGGVLHLGLNMLALAFTADRTEHEFGRVRMLMIYVAGGVLASCASVLWSEWRATPGNPTALLRVSVGASGAVMAQFGALLVALVVTPPRFVPLPPEKRPGVDPGLVLVVLANLAFGAFVPHVDQAAHVGGLLGGIAVGTLMAMVPNATGMGAALARHGAAALLAMACVGALVHTAPHERLLALRAHWPWQQASMRSWNNDGTAPSATGLPPTSPREPRCACLSPPAS